jgi:hypothetical protein
MNRVMQLWDDFWFRPASPLGPRAVRTIVAANALWIILSRPSLPQATNWPAVMWKPAMPMRALRFGIVPGHPLVEYVLFGLLHVALVCAIVGLWPRLASALSGILLYHFGAFEEVIAHAPGPAFRGLTFPILALLALSFGRAPKNDDAWSPDFRWPVALAQALFCFQYVAPAIAKLKAAGLSWASADTVSRSIIWTASSFYEFPPWAESVARNSFLCGTIAIVTLASEVLFPIVLVSPRAAAILIPLALIGHIGVAMTIGVVFLNIPMLLIFVDWDALAARFHARNGRV